MTACPCGRMCMRMTVRRRVCVCKAKSGLNPKNPLTTMGNILSAKAAGPGQGAEVDNYSARSTSAASLPASTPTSNTTSKEQNRLLPAEQLKKAGRAAVAAGLPARAKGSGDETANFTALANTSARSSAWPHPPARGRATALQVTTSIVNRQSSIAGVPYFLASSIANRQSSIAQSSIVNRRFS